MVADADVEQDRISLDVQRPSSIRMAALARGLEVGVVGVAEEAEEAEEAGDVISRAAMPMRLRTLKPVGTLCRQAELLRVKEKTTLLHRQRRTMLMTERYALSVPPMLSIRLFLRVITAPAISVL